MNLSTVTNDYTNQQEVIKGRQFEFNEHLMNG